MVRPSATATRSRLSIPSDGAQWLRDFLPFKEVTVRREGIRLHSIFYYDDVLTDLAGRRKPSSAGEI